MRQVKIIIVDDDRITLSILHKVLTEAGYKVYPTTNGEEGLKLAESVQPDLVISDVLLPKMDGLELCRTLLGKNIPVILISAVYKGAALQPEITESGALAFFQKPLNPNEVLKKIRALFPLEEKDPPHSE